MEGTLSVRSPIIDQSRGIQPLGCVLETLTSSGLITRFCSNLCQYLLTQIAGIWGWIERVFQPSVTR